MNIKHIEAVVLRKLCPVCQTGMMQEIGRKIYQCSRVRCGETFDFSLLPDEMILELLEKGENNESGAKEARVKEPAKTPAESRSLKTPRVKDWTSMK